MSLLIQSEFGKIQTRITPNTDTEYRFLRGEIGRNIFLREVSFHLLHCFTKMTDAYITRLLLYL